MRADQHVHTVYLVERQPVDRAGEVALADARRPRRAETLGCERDPSRLRQRQLLAQDCAARPAARA
ncbi:hypothetical protein GCM10009087_38340 [Sphingomonas oligophenolica]